MGKKNKEAAAEVETKAKKEAAPEFKFGVADLAEEMGIEPASVRVQLRNKKIEKAGKSYGWNSKAELKEVVAALKADKPAKKDKKSKSDDAAAADEKPAKKEKKGKKGKSE